MMKRLIVIGIIFSATVVARDPFYLPEKYAKTTDAMTPTVVGIVLCGDKAGCLVCDDEHNRSCMRLVTHGDKCGAYLVKKITQHSLVLKKGNEQLELIFE